MLCGGPACCRSFRGVAEWLKLGGLDRWGGGWGAMGARGQGSTGREERATLGGHTCVLLALRAWHTHPAFDMLTKGDRAALEQQQHHIAQVVPATTADRSASNRAGTQQDDPYSVEDGVSSISVGVVVAGTGSAGNSPAKLVVLQCSARKQRPCSAAAAAGGRRQSAISVSLPGWL